MAAPLEAKSILLNTFSMNKKYPVQIDKQWICKQLGFADSSELRKEGVFDDLWLTALGIPLNVYRRRKKFTIEESKRIIAMLQIQKWI